jgi:hypothetical protein
MNTTGYLLNAAMILVVVLQLRGRRLTLRRLLLPFAIVAFVAPKYLHGIPSSGNSVLLVAGGTAAGLALGALCGLYTRVYRDRAGAPFVRATGIAAALWILGVGARLAFVLYAEHGGGPSIVRFSVDHGLSMRAWAPAFVLMALGEVVSRTVVLLVRSRRTSGSVGPAIMAA